MYKVAVFVVTLFMSASAVGSEHEIVSNEQKLTETSIKEDISDSIEFMLKQQQKKYIDGLCKKLINEHLEKFRWLSKLNSKEQVYLERNHRV